VGKCKSQQGRRYAITKLYGRGMKKPQEDLDLLDTPLSQMIYDAWRTLNAATGRIKTVGGLLTHLADILWRTVPPGARTTPNAAQILTDPNGTQLDRARQ